MPIWERWIGDLTEVSNSLTLLSWVYAPKANFEQRPCLDKARWEPSILMSHSISQKAKRLNLNARWLHKLNSKVLSLTCLVSVPQINLFYPLIFHVMDFQALECQAYWELFRTVVKSRNRISKHSMCGTCQHGVNGFSAFSAHSGSGRFVTGQLRSKYADFSGRHQANGDAELSDWLKFSLSLWSPILCIGQQGIVGVS